MMTEAMIEYLHKIEEKVLGHELLPVLCAECEYLTFGCYCNDTKEDGCDCKSGVNYPYCEHYFDYGDYCDCPCHCPDNCEEHDMHNCEEDNLSPSAVELSLDNDGLVICWDFSYDQDVECQILKEMNE